MLFNLSAVDAVSECAASSASPLRVSTGLQRALLRCTDTSPLSAFSAPFFLVEVGGEQIPAAACLSLSLSAGVPQRYRCIPETAL